MAITRREFAAIASGMLAMGSARCSSAGDPIHRDGRLTARPSAAATALAPGVHSLDLDGARHGAVYVPRNADNQPLPLMLLCDGAGGQGSSLLAQVRPLTASWPVVVVAPDSTGPTWDAVDLQQPDLFDVLFGERRSRGFGPDVARIDRVLDRVFRLVEVDAARIVIAGFSDGATYALSLGLINGDLFRRVVAFSPGLWIEREPHGRPEIFVAHGRADRVLPIDRASRTLVPRLQERGYAVTFREFDGGHTLPDPIVREAMAWAFGPP
jgi:phospholipase/carboxylesterase